MTSDLGAPAPAAWYADPAEPGRLRWWDGGGWTEHTSVPAHEPVAAPAGPSHDWSGWQGSATPYAVPSEPPAAPEPEALGGRSLRLRLPLVVLGAVAAAGAVLLAVRLLAPAGAEPVEELSAAVDPDRRDPTADMAVTDPAGAPTSEAVQQWVAGQLAADGVVLDAVTCEPLTGEPDAASTSCSGLLDSVVVAVLVQVTVTDETPQLAIVSRSFTATLSS